MIYFLVSQKEILGVEEKKLKRKTSKSPTIGKIKDLSVVNGCGCEFVYIKSPTKYVFVINDAERTAWININGKYVELKRVEDRNDESFERKIGSEFTSIYEAAGIKILIVFTITGFCTYDPECGVTYYKSSITVEKDSSRQTIKTRGYCSCT